MLYLSKAISIAEAEVGYIEKASNANLDSKTANAGSANWTKYARDLYNAGFFNGNKNGYPWCTGLVTWVLWEASGKDKAKTEEAQCFCGKEGAGCVPLVGYYKQKGRFTTKPAVGYQIFFKDKDGDPCHTGIVYKVDSNYVYTIEGNTNSTEGVVANGGCVAKKKYAINYEKIYGYGRIKYDAEPTVKPTKYTAIEMPSLTLGMKCEEVKTLRRLLRQLEYVGADGKLLTIKDIYDEETKAAVIRYQRNHGAKNPTGDVMEWTWNKLLRGI